MRKHLRQSPRPVGVREHLGVVVRAASLVLAVLPLTACETPPARAEQPPAVTTVWRPLGSWSGDGSRQTESFDVTSGALRLRWETRSHGASGNSRFRVWLYSAISGRPLQSFVDHTGAGTGTAYVADDPRVSYLVIESQGVDWSATLDEGMTSPARSSPR